MTMDKVMHLFLLTYLLLFEVNPYIEFSCRVHLNRMDTATTLYLPTSVPAYLPTYLPAYYLPAYLPTFLLPPCYPDCPFLHTHLLLSGRLPWYKVTKLYLPTFLPAYLPTYLLAHLPTCLPPGCPDCPFLYTHLLYRADDHGTR